MEPSPLGGGRVLAVGLQLRASVRRCPFDIPRRLVLLRTPQKQVLHPR